MECLVFLLIVLLVLIVKSVINSSISEIKGMYWDLERRVAEIEKISSPHFTEKTESKEEVIKESPPQSATACLQAIPEEKEESINPDTVQDRKHEKEHEKIPELSATVSVIDATEEKEVMPENIPIPPAPDILPVKDVDRYTEKASKLEMEVAVNWFNIIGIILIMAGSIFFLRHAVSSVQVIKGVIQVVIGSFLGIGLIILGDRLFKNDMKNLGQSLISGGFCILFFTVSASYFFYSLISNPIILAGLIFILTIGSGITIFRYDSKIIANVTLLIAFITPFLMKFEISQLNILYSYLIAINLAVIVVAFFKKWDYYITTAFLMTYIHYFWNYGFTKNSPMSAVVFLTVFYIVFLLANNLIHFYRKTSSDYNLFISYFNPLLFGCVSYYNLLKTSNWNALALYLFLGAVHILMGIYLSRINTEKEDSKFNVIIQNNLVLGLMFTTTAISFITYFSQSDEFFSIVTALWLIEAILLLFLSLKYKFCEETLRYFSYFVIVIIWGQLLFVVSSMPDSNLPQMVRKFSIYFVALLTFIYYFYQMNKNKDRLISKIDILMTSLSVLSCFGIVVHLTYNVISPGWFLFIVAELAFILIYLSLLYTDRLQTLRILSYLVYLLIIPYLINIRNTCWGVEWIPYICLCFACGSTFYLLYKHRNEFTEDEKSIMGLFIFIPAMIVFFAAKSALSGLDFLMPYITVLILNIIAVIIIFLSFKFKEEIYYIRFIGYLAFSAGIFQNDPIVNIDYSVYLLVLSFLSYIPVFYTLCKNENILTDIDRFFMQSLVILPVIMISPLLLSYFCHIDIFFGNLLLITVITALSTVVLHLSLKYGRFLSGLKYLVSIVLTFSATYVLVMGRYDVAPFYNRRFFSVIIIAFSIIISWIIVRKNKDSLSEIQNTFYMQFFAALTAIVLMKGFLMESVSTTCTLVWSVVGLAVLYIGHKTKEKKLDDLAHVVFIAGLFKSLFFDAASLNVIESAITKSTAQQRIDNLNLYNLSWIVYSFIILLLISTVYYLASYLVRHNKKLSDNFLAYSLIIFSFQLSALLFSVFGVLDDFQVMLTIFWSSISLLYIVFGLVSKRKILRLFGLTLLFTSVLKIVLVDIWVLKFYGMAVWFFILGITLIATSFLYQKYRVQLTED